MSARASKRSGFSLLEVVVALAILALSLMAIFDLNAGAVASHAYVKRLTIATLLARSKMTDLEQDLYDKGFSNDDEEDSGDFSDEGWASFKWRAKIIAPRTQGMSPQQLIGGLFNLPMGGGEEGGDDALGPLAGLLGGMGGGADAAAGGAGGALAALGPMAGLMQGQFTQMVDQLTKAVREVHLTVTWKDGKQTESIDLVTHVVSLGPGSDRNGGAASGQSSTTGGPGGESAYVDAVTGAPVPNPVPGPGGILTNPATGNRAIPRVAGATLPGMTGGGTLPGGAGVPGLSPDQFRVPGMRALEKRPLRLREGE